MSAPKLRFFFREPTVDTNRPLNEGIIKVEGFEFETVGKLDKADAWDCGFAARMVAEAEGSDDVSIPAFPNRKFRLSYIYVNDKAGIRTAKDLEGKRVAINNWANTAGVWARGALTHYYGVDLTKIRWLARGLDEFALPPGIKIEHMGKRDTDALLLSGEIDAVIDPNVLPSITKRDPRVRRLFPDYKSEEQKYFRETGIFPISHVVTLRRRFVDQNPGAPVALLKAFRQARDMAIDNIQGADPQVLVLSWVSALLDEQRALMGDDYFAYNVADNRKPLGAMMQFAHEQGLTPKLVDFEKLFSPEAATSPILTAFALSKNNSITPHRRDRA